MRGVENLVEKCNMIGVTVVKKELPVTMLAHAKDAEFGTHKHILACVLMREILVNHVHIQIVLVMVAVLKRVHAGNVTIQVSFVVVSKARAVVVSIKDIISLPASGAMKFQKVKGIVVVVYTVPVLKKEHAVLGKVCRGRSACG